MSLYYLLPPRGVLADRLADSLQALLPGVDWPIDARRRLGDVVETAMAGRADVYVVHRDELPHGSPPEAALVEGFGAASGDEVVEVRPGGRPGEFHSRRWRVV
jgi:hypothetical protein